MAPKKKPEILEEEDSEKKVVTSQELLSSFLKANKEDHLNFEKTVNYTVSTGSLLLDMELGGGVRPGIIRMSGVSEGGKTSCTLSILGNHLKTVPNSKGCIIKSEGRLSEEMKSRYDYKFVYNAEDWVVGTVFVFESNVFETAISLLRQLVKNNPEEIRYFFVIDSMDAMCQKSDLIKDFTESEKVAAGAMLSSVFLKKMALAMSRLGHICVIISQVRSTVSITPYAKTDPKLTNASGGSALLHYSDTILEFQPRFKDEQILDKEEKQIGHYCKVIFRKSGNEKTGVTVRYPIKYKRKLGKSIWQELEIYEMLLAWGLIIKKKAWIEFTPDLLKILLPVIGEKKEMVIQGQNKFLDWLEENPLIIEFLIKDFKNKISG